MSGRRYSGVCRRGIGMKLTIKERILLIVYNIILYSAPVMIVVNIMEKYEHGEAIGAVVGVLFFVLWIEVLHIKDRAKEIEFRERKENRCNECDYKMAYEKKYERK